MARRARPRTATHDAVKFRGADADSLTEIQEIAGNSGFEIPVYN